MANTRPPLSIIRHFILPEVIATLLVAFYPPPIWRFSCLIVICYLCFTALLSTTGDGLQNYSIGSGLAADVMMLICLVWLVNPIHDCRHESDTSPPNEQTWEQRVYWAFSLRRNPRGIGWNYQVCFLHSFVSKPGQPDPQVSNVPLPPKNPRWSFVRRNIVRSLCLFLLCDLTDTYFSYFPLFSQADAHPIPIWGKFLDGIALVAQGARVFAVLNMQHSILGVISVAAGISESRHWPKLFGHWSDAYTVRRFWG